MFNVKLVAVFCANILILRVTGQSLEKFFRQDYKYLADKSSFFKVHSSARSWQEARQQCELEGASLFFPEDRRELNTVIDYLNITDAYNDIYIGISDSIANDMYISVKGDLIKDVYNNFATGQPNNDDGNRNCLVLNLGGTFKGVQCIKKYPFICTKTLASLKWNKLCNVPDFDYIFNETLGRCYKLHKKVLKWTEAVTVCDIEQSYLAVLDTEIEAKYLSKMAYEFFGDDVNAESNDVIALGFSNKNKNGWETILGTSLNNSEYVQWAENQPSVENVENCGYMNYDGLLKTLSCELKSYFICELENNQIGILDDRTGQ